MLWLQDNYSMIADAIWGGRDYNSYYFERLQVNMGNLRLNNSMVMLWVLTIKRITH